MNVLDRKIIFVADLFLEDGVNGGAEVCNDELICLLERKKKVKVIKIHSQVLDSIFINEHKNEFFIIANFMNLSKDSKSSLADKLYIIYEHDHKYVNTNDPSKFINMNVPTRSIVNYKFYKNSFAVLCQSKIHAQVLQKNLLIDNVINLGGNIWSDEKLDFLEKNITVNKVIDNVVLLSNNKNKGTPAALNYCKKNNIKFEGIESCSYEDFISKIAVSKNLIFFPQWLESFNRVAVEAKILGCQLTTNSLVGVMSESWFRKLKGENLIPFLKQKREDIISIFMDLYSAKDKADVSNKFLKIRVPKITIITSLYKGAEYIEHFMKEIIKQTVFDKCELLILDANSPDNEYEDTIKSYLKRYTNIKYIKMKKTLSVQETMNLGLEHSSGKFITLANIDDTRRYDAFEKLSKALVLNEDIDLVYADCYETNVPNETFQKNTSNGKLYEHSIYDFSKENMIKCQPGPMPMWRKELNEKHGTFNTDFKFAGDWEMWLRCVKTGVKFKKILDVLGLYYLNPHGLSTSNESEKERFSEERLLFHKYKEVFGERVFNQFKGYFK